MNKFKTGDISENFSIRSAIEQAVKELGPWAFTLFLLGASAKLS